MPGTSTSRPEVVQLTPAGLWLAWCDTELYLDHDRFPWFRRASVDQVFNVIEERDGHFHWPDLDVDRAAFSSMSALNPVASASAASFSGEILTRPRPTTVRARLSEPPGSSLPPPHPA